MPDCPKTLLVLGGTSDIGRATALVFAQRGWTIQLAARDAVALRREVDNIAARTGVSVTAHGFDVLQTGSFPAFVDALPSLPDIVVCVVGLLGDQRRAENDLDHATTVMRSNYEGPSLILGLFVERFLARGTGTIVGVSSVAGERGRASNYVYGSAKAAFTAFLSGLRNRCAKHGVHVLTVKPGYVKTRMTEGMKLPAALICTPEVVGLASLNGSLKRKNIIYVKNIWKYIMMMIRHIPESIFKNMSI
jgi:decaprenylphospho-beta-D-erythro-pentofuranosid-2-ulose 2-reductase